MSSDTVTIHVTDDGPGIPDDAKEAVFEKDYTTRGDGTLGFGLYFVAVTIDRYDGHVSIEDNDGRGSPVVNELPRATSRLDTEYLGVRPAASRCRRRSTGAGRHSQRPSTSRRIE